MNEEALALCGLLRQIKKKDRRKFKKKNLRFAGRRVEVPESPVDE